MKDFGQLYLRKEGSTNNNHNPLLYMSQAVKQEILEMQQITFISLNIINFASVVLTAPLTTITASLQLSVKPHKAIYQQPISKSTQVARINTALTLQQKRKMELMLRAGGQNKPYTAPVYEGYRSVIKGLISQGWQSFFKGLGFRSVHQLGHYFAFYEVGLIQGNNKGIMQVLGTGSQLMKIYIIQSCCDSLLNFLYMGENRYILQNNIPEFRVFRNASRAIRKMLMRREIFTASAYHFFYNFMQTFIRLPLYLGIDNAPAHIGILYPTQVLIFSKITLPAYLNPWHDSLTLFGDLARFETNRIIIGNYRSLQRFWVTSPQFGHKIWMSNNSQTVNFEFNFYGVSNDDYIKLDHQIQEQAYFTNYLSLSLFKQIPASAFGFHFFKQLWE